MFTLWINPITTYRSCTAYGVTVIYAHQYGNYLYDILFLEEVSFAPPYNKGIGICWMNEGFVTHYYYPDKPAAKSS